MGYRSIRALRWIGFSEDDAQTIAEGARFALPEHRVHQKLGGKAAFNFNNALSRLRRATARRGTTRSTFARLTKGGSTSPKMMPSPADARTG